MTTDSPPRRRSWKKLIMAAAKELVERVRKLPGQTCTKVRQANELLDGFEHDFKGRSLGGKAGLLFVIAATATLAPGGYIALQLWGVRKLAQWVKKDLRGGAPLAERMWIKALAWPLYL